MMVPNGAAQALSQGGVDHVGPEDLPDLRQSATKSSTTIAITGTTVLDQDVAWRVGAETGPGAPAERG
jgi:hypothetical protein